MAASASTYTMAHWLPFQGSNLDSRFQYNLRSNGRTFTIFLHCSLWRNLPSSLIFFEQKVSVWLWQLGHTQYAIVHISVQAILVVLEGIEPSQSRDVNALPSHLTQGPLKDKM